MAERSQTPAFLTGVVSGAIGIAGAACIYSYASAWWKQQAAEAERVTKHLDADTNASPQHGASIPDISIADALDDEILSEQFTRNRQFFGEDGQHAIHQAFVVVVGLGVKLPRLAATLTLACPASNSTLLKPEAVAATLATS